jgi:hypothetical protein
MKSIPVLSREAVQSRSGKLLEGRREGLYTHSRAANSEANTTIRYVVAFRENCGSHRHCRRSCAFDPSPRDP